MTSPRVFSVKQDHTQNSKILYSILFLILRFGNITNVHSQTSSDLTKTLCKHQWGWQRKASTHTTGEIRSKRYRGVQPRINTLFKIQGTRTATELLTSLLHNITWFFFLSSPKKNNTLFDSCSFSEIRNAKSLTYVDPEAFKDLPNLKYLWVFSTTCSFFVLNIQYIPVWQWRAQTDDTGAIHVTFIKPKSGSNLDIVIYS